jgi:excisionase family DNA binding protein
MTMSGLSESLSAAEAARACGVSERTIRRWVAAGRLTADESGPTMRVAARDLAAWRDNMSGQAPAGQARPDVRQAVSNGHSTLSPDTDTARPDLAALVTLVANLQHELVAKAEAAAMWQERATTLADQLAALQRPALEAGAVDSVESTAPIESVDPPRPWWQRWAWWRMER